MTPISRIALAGLLVFCTTVLAAQDRHVGNEFAGTLYARSAFAHGYIHGYEAGFHSGDLDVQLARGEREPSSIPSFKKSCVGYQGGAGPKESFRAGFENGFRAGYSDAIHWTSFRAIKSLGEASTGLIAVDSRVARRFDQGFREGYEHGRRQGGEDGRSSAESNAIQPPCLGLAEEYCDGFRRGFRLGYDDAYGNQSADHKPQKLQASAEK